ncbi:MAG: response regulator, partial [Desulfatitalea sp.]|nr:response regulator [Desulfatitalea sp.]
DIAMPGDSGLELLARVKARDPEMAIVMLTGMDSPQTAHLAFTLGADGYLLKPFDKNELLIQVAGALQRRVLEAENRHYREQLETTVDQRTAQLQKANARLKENEAAVKAKARELRDMNTALEVLLKKSEAVKGELEKHLSANTRKVIQPYLRKIAALGLTRRQLAYMELVESTLNRMVSPMIRHLDTLDTPLTPAELEVAHLIRQGRRTKEIADMLHLSVNTILTHRYHIRKKLGLLGKKANLYTALHQLQNQ